MANIAGMLILATAIGLMLFGAMTAFSDFGAQVDANTSSVSSVTTANTVANPIMTVLGFLILAVLAVALLEAFRIYI